MKNRTCNFNKVKNLRASFTFIRTIINGIIYTFFHANIISKFTIKIKIKLFDIILAFYLRYRKTLSEFIKKNEA